MYFVPLKAKQRLLLLLCLASTTVADAEEIYWPVKSRGLPPIVQGYAEFGDVAKTKYHTGLDLGVPLGTSVFPVFAGEVVLIQLLSATADHGFGRTVVMRHGGDGQSTFYSQYSHLSEIDAKLVEACKPRRGVDESTLTCVAGVTRTTEERIGKSGRSGFGIEEYPRYGEHLHLEIKTFGTLCTTDVGGTVCGYSTAHPLTVGYLDPIEWLFSIRPFPSPIPVSVTGTGVAVRFSPDAEPGKRPITTLNCADTAVPLRGLAWVASGYGCDEWIQVRRVDDSNCSGDSGAAACFQDTRDPERRSPDKFLGLIPKAWICAKYLSPLAVPTARAAVTEAVLFSGGSVTVKRAGNQGLTIELVDRDGLFQVYEAARLGSDVVSDMWSLVFLDMVYKDPPYNTFEVTHRALAASLLTRYGAGCASAETPSAKAECAVTSLVKSRRIRMGGGRYDEGQRCVAWRDAPNGAFECRPY